MGMSDQGRSTHTLFSEAVREQEGSSACLAGSGGVHLSYRGGARTR